jgi:hypothetical protein
VLLRNLAFSTVNMSTSTMIAVRKNYLVLQLRKIFIFLSFVKRIYLGVAEKEREADSI